MIEGSMSFGRQSFGVFAGVRRHYP